VHAEPVADRLLQRTGVISLIPSFLASTFGVYISFLVLVVVIFNRIYVSIYVCPNDLVFVNINHQSISDVTEIMSNVNEKDGGNRNYV
jgi:hypothetical protein